MLWILQNVRTFFFLVTMAIALMSCAKSTEGYQDAGAQAIDSTVQRPSGPVIESRPLLYKEDTRISYCESTSGSEASYSGYRDLKPYPLASVSKIFLTSWVLSTLGPDYRFQMDWRLKKISNDGTYDAYLRTNYDPIVNIEKIIFAISELNKKGVNKIRNLVIDETTRVYLSVLSNPHIELMDVPVTTNQTIENLRTILNSTNWSSQTQTAQNNLKQKISSIKVPQYFSVDSINFFKSDRIDLNAYDQILTIQSSPLLKYLKDLNVFSNNYVSDAFFSMLGGRVAFENFQIKHMNISIEDLNIYTGSGLSIELNHQRFDNVGSCLSVLKTLKFLEAIAQHFNLNMGHILLTAGMDQGTYVSENLFHRNVVLKTGRLFEVPTLNVAGISTSNNGKIYFAMMGHDFNNSDENQILGIRDHLIEDLVSGSSTAPSFLTMNLDTLFFQYKK
jgi:hypothetical protein